jgi:spore maturation protein CgeB
LRQDMAAHGRRTILARHTCAHRLEELLEIYRDSQTPASVESGAAGVQSMDA